MKTTIGSFAEADFFFAAKKRKVEDDRKKGILPKPPRKVCTFMESDRFCTNKSPEDEEEDRDY